MKLAKILSIEASIVCITGLHIGSGDSEIHIGGIDSQVVKNPVTNRPYIPGSSLKGKIRSLLEWRSGKVVQTPLSWKHTDKGNNPEVMAIIRLFGCGDTDADLTAYELIGPGRLSFWDCPINKGYEEEIIKRRMPMTEDKAENTIDRLKVAATPRHIERVPAGAIFDFRLMVKVLNSDDENALLKTVFEGLKLLEMDSLGGSGSRGYGKIAFRNLTVDGQSRQEEFERINPFRS